MRRKWQKWTTGQDAVLRECGSQGVVECRRELYRRFGVRRSVESIKSRASRIGVSLTAYELCPGCGRTTRRLKSTGLCELCHERSFTSASEQRASVMRAMERTEEDALAIAEARRARQRERQRKHRKSCN